MRRVIGRGRVLPGVVLVVLVVHVIVACASSAESRASAASAAGGDTTRDTTRRPAAVTPAETSVASTERQRGARRDNGSVPQAGHASSARGGARVTGGPQRLPTPRRSSGCGGVHLNVTVKQSALPPGAKGALRAVSDEVIAPVRAQVSGVQLSPAIHAFRVAVRDSSAAPRIMAAMRASPKVETVERDVCAASRP